MARLPPWEGYDLDETVAQAINEGNLEATVSNGSKMSLVAAVYVNERLDLFESLIHAGAIMTADDLKSVVEYTSDTEAEKIAFLLDRGVPHSGIDLYEPIRHEKWKIVLLLVDRGVDAEIFIDRGREISILHAAAWAGKASVVERLLRQRADVNSRDIDGMTPLMRICDADALHRKGIYLTLACLLRHGADPNAATASGVTALLLCSTAPTKPKPDWYAARTNVAQLLLRYGANPNAVSSAGITPLMLAARDNDVALTRTLLQANASVEIRTSDGRSAIDVAKERNNTEVLALLKG